MNGTLPPISEHFKSNLAQQSVSPFGPPQQFSWTFKSAGTRTVHRIALTSFLKRPIFLEFSFLRFWTVFWISCFILLSPFPLFACLLFCFFVFCAFLIFCFLLFLLFCFVVVVFNFIFYFFACLFCFGCFLVFVFVVCVFLVVLFCLFVFFCFFLFFWLFVFFA